MRIYAPFAILVLASVAVLFSAFNHAANASVITGSEYNYATTSAAGHTNIRSTAIAPGCTLGSVIIVGSASTTFAIWNATSTTDVGSSTMAVFQANAPAGTYTFDMACTRGISVIAPVGFNGYVITTHR